MLPFHVTKMLGLRSTHGFALVNARGIKLVFRDAQDIKTKPDEEADSVEISWDNLAQFEVTRGYLGDELVLGVHRPVGEDPDGVQDNTIRLRLQKRDRPKLDRFEQQVREWRGGRNEDDVDDVLDDVRDLLDRM